MKTVALTLTEYKEVGSLSNLKYDTNFYEPDHLKMAGKLSSTKPEVFTVIVEPIAREHLWKKAYGKRSYISLCTLFKELVFTEFVYEYGERGVNEIYAKWLDKYHEDGDEIFEKELKPRYERGVLARKGNTSKLYRPRRKLLWERYYNLPEPLGYVGRLDAYENLYIWTVNNQRYCIRGGGASSQSREYNSVMACSFAKIIHKYKVPSTVLVYSRNNILLFGAKYNSLALPRYDLGMNYSISANDKRRLEKSITLYSWDHLNINGYTTIDIGSD